MAFSFPLTFGGPAPVELDDLEGPVGKRFSFELAADMCVEGLAKLLGQFEDQGASASRRAPRLRAIACALIDGVQDAHNACWQLYTERWIDTGVGAQLDSLGTVVGQARAGRTDIVYRAFLRGRILANRSSGRWRELLEIMVTIGVELATISAAGDYPAAWVIRLSEPPADFTGADAFALLEDAKGGGIRLVVEFVYSASSACLTYGGGTPPASPTTSSSTGYGRLAAGTGGVYGSVRASSVGR